MDNDIKTQASSGIRVQIDQSRARQTPKTDFGTVLSTGLERTGNAVMDAGRIAAPYVPGGAVLSAAISGVGSLRASAAGQSMSNLSSGFTSTGGNSVTLTGGVTGTGSYASGSVSGGQSVSTSGGATTVDTLAASGNTNAVLQQEAGRMQELNMSFNMQYLMLQEKMQQEQRQFSLLSNIMKTRHDGAKNVIGNVR